jgi:hypothetical protein
VNDLRIKISADGAQQTSQALNSVGQQLQKTAASANVASASMAKLPQTSGTATQSLMNLSRVAQDAPYGFMGIANNINPLLESFQRLKVESGSTKGALKALVGQLSSGAGLGLAVGVASSLLVTFGDRLFGASKAAKEAENATSKLRDSIKGIFAEAGKEAAQVQSFIAVLKSETETRERKLLAIKELQKIQPEVFNGLKLEGNAVAGLDAAYKNYVENLRTVIAAKIAQQKIEMLITKQLELQGASQTASQKALLDGVKAFEDARLKGAKSDPSQAGFLVSQIVGKREARQKELAQVQADIDAAFNDLMQFSGGVELKGGSIDGTKTKVFLDPKNIKFGPVTEYDSPFPDLLFPPGLENIVTDRMQAILGDVPKPEQYAPITQEQIQAQINGIEAYKKKLAELAQMGQMVGSAIADAFGRAFDAAIKGENVFKALGEALKQLVLDLIKATIQTLIFRAITSAFTGGVPIPGGFGGIPGLGGAGGLGGYRMAPASSFSTGGRMVIRGRELRLIGSRTANSQIRLSGR